MKTYIIKLNDQLLALSFTYVEYYTTTVGTWW